MPLPFGVYLSLVCVTIIFATLLAIAATTTAVRRIFHGDEGMVDREGKLAKVAALAATFCYMESEVGRPPRRMVLEGRSHWSAIARMEALDRGLEYR